MDKELNESVKSHVDLWIHQNSLMWSRLQQLAFVQTGFLGLATYLYSTARSTIQMASQTVFQTVYQEALKTASQADALKMAQAAADTALKSAFDMTMKTAGTSPSPLNLAFYSKHAALLGAITTLGLLIIALTDKRLRDIYRGKIERINPDIHPASLRQRTMGEDKWNLCLESIFQAVIYIVFIALDLKTSFIFGLENNWLAYIALCFIGFGIVYPLVFMRDTPEKVGGS